MTVTVVGGTFTILHKGHRTLLERACKGSDRLVVGLSTDAFASLRKKYEVIPYDARKKNLESFLAGRGCEFEIKPLETREGSSAVDPSFDRMIVSEETYRSAVEINRIRSQRGLKELVIETVPIVLSDDLFPISSSRVLSGEIDENGKRLVPLKISVGTDNNLKLEAVREFFLSLVHNCTVEKTLSYKTEKQPFGEDISRNASLRAENAYGYDYSLGIEAGITLDRLSGSYFDVHFCVVTDRYGNSTTGISSGFSVPDAIVDLVKTGLDVSEAFEKLMGKHSIGKEEGIVGYYSEGRIVRKDLILESIRNAFVPRYLPSHYGLEFA